MGVVALFSVIVVGLLAYGIIISPFLFRRNPGNELDISPRDFCQSDRQKRNDDYDTNTYV